MGFGFAGGAAGAAQSLEEIVAQRLMRQKLEQAVAERTREFELEQSRANETATQNAFMRDQASRPRPDPLVEYEGRKKIDQQYEKPAVIKPERDPIADYESRKKIDRQYDRPVSAKPERDPIADYEARKKIDAQYASNKPQTGDAAHTASEAARIAAALRDHKGFGGAFGVLDSMLPTVNQDTADAETLRDSLTSLLTLENMDKMKGVLSDSDMKIIRQASTSLNARMGDKAARSELNRIIEVMGRAGGPMPPMNLANSHDTEGGGDADLAELQRRRQARKGGM